MLRRAWLDVVLELDLFSNILAEDEEDAGASANADLDAIPFTEQDIFKEVKR